MPQKATDKLPFIYGVRACYLQIFAIPITNKVTPLQKFINVCSCLYLSRIFGLILSSFIDLKNQSLISPSPFFGSAAITD